MNSVALTFTMTPGAVMVTPPSPETVMQCSMRKTPLVWTLQCFSVFSQLLSGCQMIGILPRRAHNADPRGACRTHNNPIDTLIEQWRGGGGDVHEHGDLGIKCSDVAVRLKAREASPRHMEEMAGRRSAKVNQNFDLVFPTHKSVMSSAHEGYTGKC